MKTIQIGKTRGLQQCSSALGKFTILALDHRNNMRRLLHPENEGLTTAKEINDFKQQVVRALGCIPSSYLLDPLYSAAQMISMNMFPRDCGMLVALEATGYAGNPSSRQSTILPDWSVKKIKKMGANGVKLLVYYHPEAVTHRDIECLVEKTAEECVDADIPLFLEILTYPLDPDRKRLVGKERFEVITESAQRLTPLGADVLKAEFPLDISQGEDEQEWQQACRTLTKVSPIPWILLSASVDFDVYFKQVMAACLGGASGVAVGRAVWKEATDLHDAEQTQFLESVARERMLKIADWVESRAESWHSYFDPVSVDENWFRIYDE